MPRTMSTHGDPTDPRLSGWGSDYDADAGTWVPAPADQDEEAAR